MRQTAYLIIAAFFVIITTLSTHAADRVALVIGNADYMFAPLTNPINDAEDITAALTDLEFDVITAKNATKREMVTALHRFTKKLARAEIGLFYYAGHGMQINGRNYLIPVKADVKAESDVEFEALDADRVLGRMRLAGNPLNLVVLDACRNNPFASSFRAIVPGLARMDAPAGTIIAYATSPGKWAMDGTGRNGIYTKHLLKALKTPNLTIQETFNEAGMGVMKETEQKQVPWTSNTPIPKFYFSMLVPEKEPAAIETSLSKPPVSTSVTESEKAALKISSNPPGAEIGINGKIVGKTPLQLSDIEPGQVTVTVSKAGFSPVTKSVKLVPFRRTVLSYDLKSIQVAGWLTLTLAPENAEVKIIGSSEVYQPGMELKEGTYKLEVSAPGHISQVKVIEISAGDDIRIAINLDKKSEQVAALSSAPGGSSVSATATRSDKATLKVTSIPLDADITINGKSVGKAPLQLVDLEPGIINITATKDGYLAETKNIKLNAFRRTVLNFDLKSSQVNGWLTLSLVPEDAAVKIIGSDDPYQPGMELKAGTYEIEVSAPDHFPQTKTVAIKAGDDIMAAFNLEKHSQQVASLSSTPGVSSVTTTTTTTDKATLKVTSIPLDADITINGKSVGKAPLQLVDLEPGLINITASKEGYLAETKNIKLNAFRRTVLNFDLKSSQVTGWLTLSLVPEDAAVKINGSDDPYQPGMELKAGTYEIEVSAPDHFPQTKTVAIKAGDDIRAAFNLEKHSQQVASLSSAPGGSSVSSSTTTSDKATLKVTSTPLDADITINGKSVGKTPMQLADLEPGLINITAAKGGYFSETKNIKLNAFRRTVLNFDLKSNRVNGWLTLSLAPVSAAVNIIGSDDPYQPGMALMAGTYKIEVFAPGYISQTKTIAIKAGDDIRVAFNLDKYTKHVAAVSSSAPTASGILPEKGSLKITSRPEGAGVKINDVLFGNTPLSLDGLEPGVFDVAISRRGYMSGSKQVKVARGDNSDEHFVLLKDEASGNLTVQTEPEGADIRLVNYNVEYAPKMELDPGHYQVEVGADGFATSTRWVALSSGDELQVEFSLDLDSFEKQRLSQSGEDDKIFIDPITGMEFIFVPGGCYIMGCGPYSATASLKEPTQTIADIPLWQWPLLTAAVLLPTGCKPDTSSSINLNELIECKDFEMPAFEVCIDNFYMGRFEVSQGEYQKIMGSNPSFFKKGDQYPVEKVSWYDARKFIDKLNRSSAKRYRLPTEAEWEYAARGCGKDQRYACEDGVAPEEAAWFIKNSQESTNPIGSKVPNVLGLYDMSGNVWEWTSDWFDGKYYKSMARKASPPQNPRGPNEGTHRVHRGGSWRDFLDRTRATHRDKNLPTQASSSVGFRLVLPAKDI